MKLVCNGCKRTIEPEDAMVVVSVDQPVGWTEPSRVVQRLEFSRGRWHYRCAPVPIKRYASAVMPPRVKEE